MASNHRPLRRWLGRAVMLAPLVVLAACQFTTSGSAQYPSSTFQHTTDYNRAIDALWDRLFVAGTVVFVLVEAVMIYIVVKYRAKPGQREPRHVHGNTTLEILWTVIPAVILATIAIPTVQTIFKTQAKAVTSALQVEVVGHQWWWEFRYPQYTSRNAATGRVDTLVTANELYLPKGRTVNFALRTADVLHSFWIPRLGGKRDLIANHTNYMWFTPDSVDLPVLNGSCNEYCGSSHANMKFRTFVVDTTQFASWVAGQLRPAAMGAVPAPAATAAAVPALAARADQQGGGPRPAATTRDDPATQVAQATQAEAGRDAAPSTTPVQPAANDGAAGYVFPREQLARYAYAVPSTPVPENLKVAAAAPGNAAKGEALLIKGGCIGCHMINGSRVSVGRLGPNLTHIATRTTIAGAQFPNTTPYLARWLKNAPAMKPGSKMPTIGQGEVNPQTKQRVNAPAGLTDQEIMDLVAYLQALK